MPLIFNLIFCILCTNYGFCASIETQSETPSDQNQTIDSDTDCSNKKLLKKKKKTHKYNPYAVGGCLAGGLVVTVLVAKLINDFRATKKVPQHTNTISPDEVEQYVKLVEAKFKNKKNLRMVIGAGDEEHDYTIRFKDYDFVLSNGLGSLSGIMCDHLKSGMAAMQNNCEKHPMLLPLDFNSDRFWQFLDNMPECFSEITFDDGVAKYASSWTGKNLINISGAIGKGGIFCFPVLGLANITVNEFLKDKQLANFITENWAPGVYKASQIDGSNSITISAFFNESNVLKQPPESVMSILDNKFFVVPITMKQKTYNELKWNILHTKFVSSSSDLDFYYCNYFYDILIRYVERWYPGKSFSTCELKQGKYPSEDKQWVKHPTESASFEDVLFSVFTK